MSNAPASRLPAVRTAARWAVYALALSLVTPTWSGAAPSEGKPSSAVLQRGAGVFAQSCATCHGFKGKGDGPLARSFVPAPVDLTTGPYRHGDSQEAVLKSVSLGVPGTAMTGFKGRLSAADIEAVVAFVRSLQKQP